MFFRHAALVAHLECLGPLRRAHLLRSRCCVVALPLLVVLSLLYFHQKMLLIDAGLLWSPRHFRRVAERVVVQSAVLNIYEIRF